MNNHIVHLPVLQSLTSQICMFVRTSKGQMINIWYQNQLFLGCESGSAERLDVDVLEDDAILDLRPERPSRWAIRLVVGVVAWGESHSYRYSDQRLTWSLPGHIWPWPLSPTSIFSKDNTEINYKLNYDVFLLFLTHKSLDYASSA